MEIRSIKCGPFSLFLYFYLLSQLKFTLDNITLIIDNSNCIQISRFTARSTRLKNPEFPNAFRLSNVQTFPFSQKLKGHWIQSRNRKNQASNHTTVT